MKNTIINLLIAIIVIAIVILGYHIFSKYYFNYQNEKNIEDFLNNNFEEFQKNDKLENVSNKNMIQNNEQNSIENDIQNSGNNTGKVEIPMYEGYKVLGMININKINLSYPIIESKDDKDEALKVSIIKFFGNEINENGNVVLAGHNYYDSTMFAKLHFLENGDKIKIVDTSKRIVEYVVCDKYSTSPNDITCLQTTNYDNKELTLITCTKGNSQRLVIKAKEIN